MNKYPRGKIREDDEGQLAIKISVKDQTVFLEFNKGLMWIGLGKKEALTLASALVLHADSILDH